MTVLASFIEGSYLLVVVVVFSFEIVVPESDLVTLPLIEVEELLDGVESVDAGGAVTTVVGAGVTTVVLFSDVPGAGVAEVVVVVRSQAARPKAPTMTAMAGKSFLFMAIAPVDCRDPRLEGVMSRRVRTATRVGVFSYIPRRRRPSMR
jgi:hypothetical protein